MLKTTTQKIVALIIVLLVLGSIFLIFNSKQENEELTTLRMGWQTPWATQGQLTQILKHTSILEDNGLQGDFKGFSSGAPLNEAALAKEVDVIFTADQPAATLISKSNDWVIIGRLMYNRVSLYVPPNSSIKNISDLKGKTVAMPFGAAAQRMALRVEKEAGLDPTKDVKNINLGIYEQSDLVKSSRAGKWGEIDAMAGFDPTPAIFEEKGLIRYLHTENVVSLIVMSKEFIAKNPDAPEKFLNSMKESYEFYRINASVADNWFIEESKLNVSINALKTSAAVEPNLQVNSKEDICLGFIASDYLIMQQAADFLYENKMITSKVNMTEHVDNSYLK
jgi:ABC-type nitrate/sulfonate/bicarbonate transport system substrate-binding protein